jgi:hypothetical protein
MRVRAVFVAAIVVVALAPTGALAKGVVSVDINGPGTGHGISLDARDGGSGSGGDPAALAEESGFYSQVAGAEPAAWLEGRPKGDLGPRYVVGYRMDPGGESVVVQHIYPFAERGPVTYMEPGQTFFETESTRGGWFAASPELVDTLRAIGLPKKAPPAAAAAPGADAPKEGSSHAEPAPSSTNWLPWSGVAAAAIVMLAGGRLLAMRRARSIPNQLHEM